jgi:hypothetical protein
VELAEVSNLAIEKRFKELGWTRNRLAAETGYSKLSIDKALAGVGSDAVKHAVCEALGLIPRHDAQSNGRVDLDTTPPVVRAGSIAGGTTDSGLPVAHADVVLPGALVLMALDHKLPFDQVVTLARVYDVLLDSGGPYDSVGVGDWQDLYSALKPWL